jgi:hypothetical protein
MNLLGDSFMKRSLLLGILVLALIQPSVHAAEPARTSLDYDSCSSQQDWSYSSISNLYYSLQGDRPSYEAFSAAIEGLLNLKKLGIFQNDNILTLIDYSLSSFKKRLWVIDIKNELVLYNELVAHGINSGYEFAEHFSNDAESYMSSLGFYATGSKYDGKNGLSLQLDGLEKGVNDNARSRAIVVHMAKYVSQSYINQYGHLGRSFGCPSLPNETGKKIIDTIAGGTCLFIYYPDITYFSKSVYINEKRDNNFFGGPLSSK